MALTFSEPLRRIRRSATYRGALVGLACGLLCWAAAGSQFLQRLDNWEFDTYFLLRGVRSTSAPIVIIEIDPGSIKSLKKPLQFISPELAKVIRYVRRGEIPGGPGGTEDAEFADWAVAVGLDLFIPSDVADNKYLNLAASNPQAVGDAIFDCDGTLLPFSIGEEGPLSPLKAWEGSVIQWPTHGCVNIAADADGIVRLQRLKYGPELGFALALYALAKRRDAEWFAGNELRTSTGRLIPVDAAGRLRINFVGPPGTLIERSGPADQSGGRTRIKFSQVLEEIRQAEASGGPTAKAKEFWTGKIVLIGVTDKSLSDLFLTPYSGQSSLRELISEPQPMMAGVELHANALSTIYDEAFITTPWWLSAPVTLILTGVLLGAFLSRSSLQHGAIVTVAHHLGWRLFSYGAFVAANWRVSVIPVLVLALALYAVSFALRWRWIRRMFGMFKSETVAQAIESDRSMARLYGEERDLSLLFVDVRGFTAFTESNTPNAVVTLLNSYFSAVIPIVEACGGTVNQYIGDGLMVMFGAPQRQPDHAFRATRAAIELVREVRNRADEWARLGSSDFRVGAGVSTGTAVVGTIGSPNRLDYTAIGDTVNCAARIESANKTLGTEILISDHTRNRLDATQLAQLDATFHPIVRIHVKGREVPLEVVPVSILSEDAPRPSSGSVKLDGSVLT